MSDLSQLRECEERYALAMRALNAALYEYDDLLKIEAGRMELVKQRAQRQGIDLKVAIAPGAAAISANERKLKQIVLNVLSNAVKFTQQGGTVTLAAERKNGALEIHVRDTGAGIAPADQAAPFEEFRQVGADAARRARGLALRARSVWSSSMAARWRLRARLAAARSSPSP